jgi:hypothetical protein
VMSNCEPGWVPRGATPTAAELRRRGYRALLGRAAATLVVVVLAAGGTLVWASGAGGQRDTGVVDQPRPAPSISPPSTNPSPPATTLQGAADDLVQRLLSYAMALRASGFRPPAELGPPDLAAIDFLYELGEMAAAGGDIRGRLFS